ncbi:MAG: DEAD/DEAH box helicase [Pirellulaceae bacterium]
MTGNWLNENDMVICRLDKLSRNDDLKAKFEATDWDLVVVDEAHKMSATFFGGEINETKRFKLGKLLGKLTRHLLLMSATLTMAKLKTFSFSCRFLIRIATKGNFGEGVHVEIRVTLCGGWSKSSLSVSMEGRFFLNDVLTPSITT